MFGNIRLSGHLHLLNPEWAKEYNTLTDVYLRPKAKRKHSNLSVCNQLYDEETWRSAVCLFLICTWLVSKAIYDMGDVPKII